jgi:di/tricarboxylate transporter
VIRFAPLATRERRVTFMAILVAVLVVSVGLLHPALGFGGAVLILFLFGILRPPAAYESIDLKIVLFLGAMLGIGETLEHTGALELLSAGLVRFTGSLSPFILVVLLIFVSSALSNAINNAAAAVFMAPLAVGMAAGKQFGDGGGPDGCGGRVQYDVVAADAPGHPHGLEQGSLSHLIFVSGWV